MAKSTVASGKDTVRVDFRDTESRGGKKGRGARKHYPPGDYAVKVKTASVGKSSEKETPGIFVTYKITQGKYKNQEVADSLWLTEKSMWRVRSALEALGMKIPSKAVNINVKNMVGKECAITLDDEEYDEKVYSRVVDAFLLSELADMDTADDAELDSDDEDEDDEEESDDEDEEDDEEAEDDDDLEEIDI